MADGGSLKPPSNFLLNYSSQNPSESSRDWTAWLEQFDFYMVATEKNQKEEQVQVATLLTVLGAQGQELFRTFDLNNADRKKIKPVKEAFRKYFSPKVKEEFERYKFHSRVQQPNEPFDKFLAALRSLISTCNFEGGEKDKALRDRIVFGIQSKAVREELFNVSDDLTLEKCIAVCQRFEATKQYLEDMDKVSPETTYKAHAMTSSTKTHTPRQQQRRQQPQGHINQHQQQRTQQQQQQITNCNYCG